MDQEKIGKFILKIRKENNLSQSKFADRLNVTSQAVSKWENGRGIPDIEMLKKISDEFNVDIDEIITGTKKDKKKNYNIIILLIVFIFIVIGLCIYMCEKNNKDLDIATISTNKENFSVTGVLATDNNKTTIYISNITYEDESIEKKYIAIETTLYEETKNNYKILSKYGNLDEFDADNKDTYSLIELLKDVTFNVANYSDSCSSLTNHSFYITINALDESGNVIAYKIPLMLIDNCNK